MKKTLIETGLRDKGYTEEQSAKLSSDLSIIAPQLMDGIEKWIVSGEITDYDAHGISTNDLMNEYGLRYPAAVLTIDWINREPEDALAAIQRGIR